MSGGRLYLSGAGAVTWAGLGIEPLAGALAGQVPFATEEPTDGLTVQVGRVGRLSDEESAASYKRWGQLDTYSRYGFVAARLALADAGVDEHSAGREGMGVLLGTAFGCMEENQRFDRYRCEEGLVKGASPLVFKGTVDNAPAGWVAVAFKLQGPNATFVSGDGAAFEALWSAEGNLRSGRAPALLVGGVERFVDLHHMLRERDSAKQGEVLSEGAGIVVVEHESSLAARGRTPDDARARLVGVFRSRGTVDQALAAARDRCGIAAEDVGLESLAVPAGDKARLGEFHGAWGGVALCAALVRLKSENGGWNGRRYALIHGFAEGEEHFVVVLADPNHQEER